MSRAYYNEIDPDKAEWLREVIKAGIAAPGDVDERSICDVSAGDLRGYTQCHFFAGIGVWSYALRLAGWPDSRPVWTGSCPCPSFSAAGKGLGFADPRHLWPEWYRLIRECRPGTVFGEQVAAAIGHGWLDLVCGDVEAEGYAIAPAVLGAHSAGSPNIRQRLYFCADSDRQRDSSQRDIRGSDGGAAEARGEVGIWRGDDVGDSSSGFDGDTAQRGLPMCGSASGNTGHAALTSEPLLSSNAEHDGHDSANGTETITHSDQSGVGLFDRDGGTRSSDHSLGTRLEGLLRDVREWRGPGWLDPLQARSASEAGATRGFWADCDWWYGRDGKYRPIGGGISPLVAGSAKPCLFKMVDGSSEGLGCVRDEHLASAQEEIIETAKRHQIDPGEAVLTLWQAYAAKTVAEREIGRCYGLREAPVLFSFVRQLTKQGWPLTQGVSRESAEDARIMLRGVRCDKATSCPSCGRGLDEQQPKQCSDPLHILSSLLARHAQAAWTEAFYANAADNTSVARVLRLKGYGDAINPWVAKAFIEAYLES